MHGRANRSVCKNHYHAAVWIDHTQAKVYSLNRDAANEWRLVAVGYLDLLEADASFGGRGR